MNTFAHYEELYENSACGLIIFRQDGNILHANKTLLKWLSADVVELKAQKFPDLLVKGGKLYYNLFVHPILQLHAKVDEISFEMKTPAGSFPMLFSAVTHQLDNEAETVIAGTIFKIADRKKYEAELMKEKAHFENQNEAKTEALTTIAFKQAHLIRAPLANIMGLIELLEENPEVDSNTKQLLDMLVESAHNLDTVVRDIVDLSK